MSYSFKRSKAMDDNLEDDSQSPQQKPHRDSLVDEFFPIKPSFPSKAPRKDSDVDSQPSMQSSSSYSRVIGRVNRAKPDLGVGPSSSRRVENAEPVKRAIAVRPQEQMLSRLDRRHLLRSDEIKFNEQVKLAVLEENKRRLMAAEAGGWAGKLLKKCQRIGSGLNPDTGERIVIRNSVTKAVARQYLDYPGITYADVHGDDYMMTGRLFFDPKSHMPTEQNDAHWMRFVMEEIDPGAPVIIRMGDVFYEIMEPGDVVCIPPNKQYTIINVSNTRRAVFLFIVYTAMFKELVPSQPESTLDVGVEAAAVAPENEEDQNYRVTEEEEEEIFNTKSRSE